jgi:hypothetical protein
MSGIIRGFIFQISLLCLSVVTLGYASPAMADPVPVAWLGIEALTSNFTKKYQAKGAGLIQLERGEPPASVTMEHFILPSREIVFRGKRRNEIPIFIRMAVHQINAEPINVETKTTQISTLEDNTLLFEIDADDGEFTIFDYYARAPLSMSIGDRVSSSVARVYQNESLEKLVSVQIGEYSLREINSDAGKFEFCETTSFLNFDRKYELGTVVEDCQIFDRENHLESFIMRVEDRKDGTRFEVAGKIEITD